jgi:hypothetical protein
MGRGKLGKGTRKGVGCWGLCHQEYHAVRCVEGQRAKGSRDVVGGSVHVVVRWSCQVSWG